MTNLLPKIIDVAHYNELFKKDEVWLPAIASLAKKYQLTGNPIRSSRGSHIVYRVGNCWIKMMAPQFSKDMAFEIAGLECALDMLNIATPKIIGRGELEGWHYIIISHIDGTRIGDLWGQLTLDNKIKLARQIAQATLSCQSCKPNKQVHSRGDWNEFIEARYKNIVANHQEKKMDAQWLAGLPKFLGKFDLNEFTTPKPVFLHADLTWDHFLVTQTAGEFKISGVIDFADCRSGHAEYDIAASAAFIFKGEARPMREYLKALGFEHSEINARLSEKILAWTCLHQYSNLNNYFITEIAKTNAGDFSALAKLVYPLGEE